MESSQKMELGVPYIVKMVTGEAKQIIILGYGYDGNMKISINGVKGTYPSLDIALGGPYIEVSKKGREK